MERIKLIEQKRSADLSEMESITKKMDSENRTIKTEDESKRWIELKVNVENYNAEIEDNKLLQTELNRTASVITSTPEKKYDLFKAIREFSENKLSGYELEKHQEIERKWKSNGQTLNGLGIPQEAMQRSTLNSTDGASITQTMTNTTFPYTYASIIQQLGIQERNISGSNLKISFQNGVTSTFVSEGSGGSEFAPTIGSATLTPRLVSGFKNVSKQLLNQTDPQWQNDFIQDLNNSVDRAVITELFANKFSTVSYVSGFDSGATTIYPDALPFAKMLGSVDSSIMKAPKFATTNAIYGRGLYQPAFTSGSTVYGYPTIINDVALGRPVIETDLLPANHIFYGDFAGQCWIGKWNDIELIQVQDIASAKIGEICFIVNALRDVCINPYYFSKVGNIKVS